MRARQKVNPAYSRRPGTPAGRLAEYPSGRDPGPAWPGLPCDEQGGTMTTDTETSQHQARAGGGQGQAWWRGQRRMSTYRIEGGAPLRGRIKASGAKNAATKQIVASLLTDEEVVLHNVPQIGDVAITI